MPHFQFHVLCGPKTLLSVPIWVLKLKAVAMTDNDNLLILPQFQLL